MYKMYITRNFNIHTFLKKFDKKFQSISSWFVFSHIPFCILWLCVHNYFYSFSNKVCDFSLIASSNLKCAFCFRVSLTSNKRKYIQMYAYKCYNWERTFNLFIQNCTLLHCIGIGSMVPEKSWYAWNARWHSFQSHKM